jgi:fructose-1,6-bisphosphatase/inositol monophosphatase family enzyme
MDAAEPEALLAVFAEVEAAVREALAATPDWGLAGTRDGQHRSDLAADAAALGVLRRHGLAVLSEESGRTGDGEAVVVVDPLDGSMNASRGVPWYAVSLCAVVGAVPVAALVADLVHGTRFEAVRGGGARRDGEPIAPNGCTRIDHSIVGLSGLPPRSYGWRQFRALGAAALDLCAVACGTLDGFVDCSTDAHGVWDYLGALLVCREAGACIADAHGRELVVIEHGARRTPVAAATPELLESLIAGRREP